MSLLIRSIYCLMLFLAFSCVNNESTNQTKSASNKIVLVFKEPPINNRVKFESGLSTGNDGAHEISYIDDQFFPRFLQLNYESKYDTVVISTLRSKVEVQHSIRGIDKFNYLFSNGDTVLFEYKEGIPEVKAVNNITYTYQDLNYEAIKRKAISKDDFPASAKLYFPFSFFNFSFKAKELKEEIKRVVLLIDEEIQKEMELELRLLDSLHSNKNISTDFYRFYKQKSKYESLRLNLHKRGLLKDSIIYPDVHDYLDSSNDSLLHSVYYRDGLNLISNLYYNPKVSRIISETSNQPNYKELYDTIKFSKSVEGALKNVLLLKVMENIIATSSASEIQSYIERFKIDYQDSSGALYLKNKYNLGLKVDNQLKLSDLNGNNTSLDELLKLYKGKLIYIDFWASWCGPCIKAIPSSIALKKEYENEDIVFIYLSKDENRDRWIKATKKLGLTDIQTSFLIDNQFSSKFLEDINLVEIPRYILIDREGNIVHRNAPEPGGTEIKGLIKKYLQL